MSEEAQVEEKEESSVEEAGAKTGIKESGTNEDALEALENKEESSEPEEVALPSFFIEEEDRIRIKVDCLFDKDTGKLQSVVRSDVLELDKIDILASSTEWFEFLPVSY
ncbi:MAG: hypothetical protein ACXABY_24135, partial [Candidatus Thorarchaeota archaeon]